MRFSRGAVCATGSTRSGDANSSGHASDAPGAARKLTLKGAGGSAKSVAKGGTRANAAA